MAGEERWAAVEDVGRLRDGLGVPVPPGHARRVHRAGRRPARRPGRPLRPHPRPVHRRRRRRPARPRRRRRPADPAAARRARAGCSRASSGPPAPGPSGATPRCCAAAAPVAGPAAPGGRAGRARGAGRFLPAWQHVPASRRRAPAARASTACVTVVEQLAGCAGTRLAPGVAGAGRAGSATTSRPMLDELTATGEVLWAGHGALPGDDGWVSLHLADQAPLTLPEPDAARACPSCTRPSSTPSPAAAPGSSASSPTGLGSTDDRRSPPPSGTSSGPAASATTRSPRCGR